MEDPRLHVTQAESKRLFQNLHEDFKSVFEKVYTGIAKDKTPEEYERQWEAADREFRNAYELSRFALDVEGLSGYENNVEIFRINCEDIDGMEPTDRNLLNDIKQLQASVETIIYQYAVSRRSVPARAVQDFDEVVALKRKKYEKMNEESFNTYQAGLEGRMPQVRPELPDLDLYNSETIANAINAVLSQARDTRIVANLK